MSPAVTHSSPTPAAPRVAELDGLRGIAIVLVLLVHFGARIPPDSVPSQWIQALCRSGWCGVDLFFVLSGFLITGILLDTRDAPGYFRKFFARRMLRIFPLYYGVLFVAFVLLPLVAPRLADSDLQDQQFWLWSYLSNFTSLTEGAEPWRGELLNFSHFWSLAIEEQFYLCWPFVVWTAGRRRLALVCWGLIVVALPLRCGAHHLIGPFAPYYFTFGRIDTLACGALGAIAVRSYSAEQIVPIARRLMFFAGVPLAGLFVARQGLLHYDLPVATIGFSLLAAFFTGLVLLTHCRRDTRWGAGMRHPVLQELGRVSYSIYIFHGLFQTLLWRLADPIAAAAANYLTAVVVYVTITGGFAYVCALLTWPYEAAFLRLKRLFDYAAPAHAKPRVPARSELVETAC